MGAVGGGDGHRNPEGGVRENAVEVGMVRSPVDEPNCFEQLFGCPPDTLSTHPHLSGRHRAYGSPHSHPNLSRSWGKLISQPV